MKNRVAHLVNAVLIAFFFVVSMLYFDDLPGQIPMHFDLGGTPDRYADTTLLRWLLLPAITTVVALVLYGGVWLTKRHPNWINVLSQEKYNSLTLPDKKQVIAVVHRWLYWTATGVIILFAVLQFGTYRVAHDATDDLPFWPVVPVALLALLAMSLVWLTQETERRIDERYSQNRT